MGPTLGARAATLARRAGIAAALATALLTVLPGHAVATVRQGCTATGTSTSGGVIDLTTNAVWHVRSTDRIQMAGTAPKPMTFATVRATALGFGIPLGGGPADPATEAQSDNFEITTLAILGRVFLISGEATGPDGAACDGEVQVIIDDVNPLLTALGGGSLVGILIGFVLLGFAVRDPLSLPKRIIGLIGMALIGAGVSVALQQFVPPSAVDAAKAQVLERSPWIESVVGPTQLSLDPLFLAQASILALLIMVLLPFPSQLFNSTLEQNWDDIRGAFRRVPVVRRFVRATAEDLPKPAPKAWWRQPAVLVFVLISGVLYGLLDPTFGLTTTSLVTYVGLVAGLVIVTWFAALPSRVMHGRLTGDRGRAWVIPATIVVAAFCVLISRLVGFMPGYLYGLVFGYAFVAKIDPAQEGRAGAIGAWWMLAVAFIAWLTLGAVRIPGVEDTIPGTVAESILAALMVAGVEGVVFALMPLRFLPGELVFRWQRWRWVLLYGVGLAGFVFVLLNPANGYLPPEGSVPFIVALVLFIGFGIASILFWGYFRFRPKRQPA